MTRAKAKEVLDEAGYLPATGLKLSDMVKVMHSNGTAPTLEISPQGGRDLESECDKLHAQMAAAERNITLLTALLRAVSPARFGLSQTLEQMCKEAGIS